MIGELCPKYKSGAICTRIRVIPNDSYITAGTGFEAVFHTIPTPTVCDSVPWIVEGH